MAGAYIYIYCGPGSSVGIATELRAGGSGIESRLGRDFPPVQTGPGGKVRPGRATDNSQVTEE